MRDWRGVGGNTIYLCVDGDVMARLEIPLDCTPRGQTDPRSLTGKPPWGQPVRGRGLYLCLWPVFTGSWSCGNVIPHSPRIRSQSLLTNRKEHWDGGLKELEMIKMAAVGHTFASSLCGCPACIHPLSQQEGRFPSLPWKQGRESHFVT